MPNAPICAEHPTARVARGTVAERTIAPALKADEPQGSGGSNPPRSAEPAVVIAGADHPAATVVDGMVVGVVVVGGGAGVNVSASCGLDSVEVPPVLSQTRYTVNTSSAATS